MKRFALIATLLLFAVWNPRPVRATLTVFAPEKFTPTFVQAGNPNGCPFTAAKAARVAKFDAIAPADIVSNACGVTGVAATSLYGYLKTLHPTQLVFGYRNGWSQYGTPGIQLDPNGLNWIKANHGNSFATNDTRWTAKGGIFSDYLIGPPIDGYDQITVMANASPSWQAYWAQYAQIITGVPLSGGQVADGTGIDGIFADNVNLPVPPSYQVGFSGNAAKQDYPIEYATSIASWTPYNATFRASTLQATNYIVAHLGGMLLAPNWFGLNDPAGWASTNTLTNPPWAGMDESGVGPVTGGEPFIAPENIPTAYSTMAALTNTRVLWNNVTDDENCGARGSIENIYSLFTGDDGNYHCYDLLWYELANFHMGFDTETHNGLFGWSSHVSNANGGGLEQDVWQDEFDPAYLHPGHAVGAYFPIGNGVYGRRFQAGTFILNSNTGAPITVTSPFTATCKWIDHTNYKNTGAVSATATYDLRRNKAIFCLESGHTINEGNTGAAPLGITSNSPLPGGTKNAVYSTQTLTASGGTAPYTFTVFSGTLCTGLTLSSPTISGTPTVAQTCNFTIRVTDAAAAVSNKAFSITIADSVPPPTGTVTDDFTDASSECLSAYSGSHWSNINDGGTTNCVATIGSSGGTAAYDASTSGAITATPKDLSLTVANVANRVMLLFFESSDHAEDTTTDSLSASPTYNSVTTSSIAAPIDENTIAFNVHEERHYVVAPTTGSHNCEWALATLTSNDVSACIVVNGAAQSSPIRTPSRDTVNTYAGAESASVDCATASGDLVVSVLTMWSVVADWPTITPGAGITLRTSAAASTGPKIHVLTQAATGTTTTVSATWTGVHDYSLICYPVKPAGGSNGAFGKTASTTDFTGWVARNLATTYAANQTCAVNVLALPADGSQGAEFLGVAARVGTGTGASRSLYESVIYKVGSTQFTSLAKIIPGSFTTLAFSNTEVWAATDTLKLSAQGSTIAVLHNGTVVSGMSVTDTDIPSGACGVVGLGGSSTTSTLTHFVGTGTFGITTTTLPSGINGTAYSSTIATTGGSAPITFSLIGTLPTGLTLNASTGEISGTPTGSGTSSFTIRATDNGAVQSDQPLSILITSAPMVINNTSPLTAGTWGVPYTITLTASGGITPYAWDTTSGTICTALTLHAATGIIDGTPTLPQTCTVTYRATDAELTTATKSLAITINPNLSVTTTNLPSADTRFAYSAQLAAQGGNTAYTWAVTSGTINAGLTLHSNGLIDGTPSGAGTSSFTVTVTDANAVTATKALSITAQAPTSSLVLGRTTFNQQYTSSIVPTSGVAPFVWSFRSGVMPTGLNIAANTGILAGKPTSRGSYSFTIRITDSMAATEDVVVTMFVDYGGGHRP